MPVFAVILAYRNKNPVVSLREDYKSAKFISILELPTDGVPLSWRLSL